MDGMPLRFLSRSLALTTLLLVTACGQVSTEKNFVSGPSSSPGSGSATPPSNGSVVSSAGFFIKLTGSKTGSTFAKFLHQADATYGSDIGTTNFSSECKIANGAAAGNDVLCVAEVEELDLFFNNISVQYHVPASMCTYLMVRPYWFYAYEPGIGPTVVSHEVSSTGAITDVLNTTNGVPTCDYNHISEGGANCCFGTYTHTTTTYDSVGGVTATTSETGDWGGKFGSCAAGPGTSSSFETNPTSKIPLPKYHHVLSTGINDSFTMDAPNIAIFNNTNKVYSNVWTANFYNPSEHTGGKPAGLLSPAGDSSVLSKPADAYDFRCLDGAEDLQQRIRLFIRDWNTASIAENGDPDATGADPNFPTFPINDRSDWLDFGDDFPTSDL